MPLVSLFCFQVKSIVQQLLVNLDTPSQEVQESISNCLHPLMPAVREEAADIVASLLNKVCCVVVVVVVVVVTRSHDCHVMIISPAA